VEPGQRVNRAAWSESPWSYWPGYRVAIAAVGEDPALDHSLGQLLDEHLTIP